MDKLTKDDVDYLRLVLIEESKRWLEKSKSPFSILRECAEREYYKIQKLLKKISDIYGE